MSEKLEAECPMCGFLCKSISSWDMNSLLKPNMVTHQFRCPRCHNHFRKVVQEKPRAKKLRSRRRRTHRF